jgi:hypothetical protein
MGIDLFRYRSNKNSPWIVIVTPLDPYPVKGDHIDGDPMISNDINIP